MNDATPWIDPELIAAGQLLQSRGLIAPDRTQAALSEVRSGRESERPVPDAGRGLSKGRLPGGELWKPAAVMRRRVS